MNTTGRTMTSESRQSPPQANFKKPFPLHGTALKWGALAGLAMGVYLVIINMIGANSISLGFLKYIFLGAALIYGLGRYHRIDHSSRYFQRGIILGSIITFYAAVVMIAIGLVAGAIDPDLAFSKFGLVIDSPADWMAANATTLFETLAFGVIVTFICLQYWKNKSYDKPDADEPA